MAWRDARPQWRRLFLYVASITIGIGAIVAIQTFNRTISKSVDDQAKVLLGADLSVDMNSPFPDSLAQVLDTLGSERAREIRFTSMILHNSSGTTRIGQIRALDGPFPFYGEFTLSDEERPLNPVNDQAYVDENLSLILSIAIGDSIQIGKLQFVVKDIIKKIPGESALASFIGPRVYIPYNAVSGTGLIQRGSRVGYYSYHKIEDESTIKPITDTLKTFVIGQDLDVDTVESRKNQLGRALENLNVFLNLIAFISLLLGGIGVGSSINVLARQKRSTISLLRCLGLSSTKAILIFVIQASALGIIGALTGIGIGLLFLPIFPLVVNDLLPVTLDLSIDFQAILSGFTIGLIFTFIFILIPLLPMRKTSPLETLRIISTSNPWKDWATLLVSFLAFLLITGFVWIQIGTLKETLFFVGGLIVAIALLASLSIWFRKLIKWLIPENASFTLKQGLSNLYRPNNQTMLMVMSIGLGTFLISTIYLTQDILLKEVELSGSENQPNMVLFDIQYDQKETVKQLISDYEMPLINEVPVVTMRLSAVKNKSVHEIITDTVYDGISRWSLEREYRNTYRDKLNDAEKIVEGDFIGKSSFNEQPVPISIETEFSQSLNVGLGDTLTFDVQGISLKTVVSSLRKIDWQRFEPNFFILFPTGVLENAPQFFVTVTRYEDPANAAAFKRDLVITVPNVSVIDLSLIIQTLQAILDKVKFAVQFMALFSILTGLIVLISSLIINRDQRVKESVLLRTLGAVKSTIKRIQFNEFVLLGIMASLTGSTLSIVSSFALSKWIFLTTFTLNIPILISTFMIITLLIVAIGLTNSRGISERPPLDILRSEW